MHVHMAAATRCPSAKRAPAPALKSSVRHFNKAKPHHQDVVHMYTRLVAPHPMQVPSQWLGRAGLCLAAALRPCGSAVAPACLAWPAGAVPAPDAGDEGCAHKERHGGCSMHMRATRRRAAALCTPCSSAHCAAAGCGMHACWPCMLAVHACVRHGVH